MEEVQWEIRKRLYYLPFEKLTAVVTDASIPVKHTDNTQAKMTAAIEKFITVSASEEESGLEKLTGLLAIMKVKTDHSVSQNLVGLSVKKDFNLVGTINGQNGISFLNVVRQMEAGSTKGYGDLEIIHAVIRAIHPTQELRSYLESQETFSLPVVRKLLRCYFREKTATELYQELSEGRQIASETTLDFVLRLLTLGQKITFTSKEEGSGLCYDPTLVRQMTLRSIYTGLSDPTIGQELKPILESSPKDDEIVSKVNQVVAAADERNRKHPSSRSQRCKVASIETDVDVSSVVTMLNELKADIAAVKEDLHEHTRTKGQTTERRTQKGGCHNCKKTGEKCHHCYYCGSDEHFISGCKAKRQNSGNGAGTTRRDS